MRLKSAAYWTIPQIFSLVLYWPGLLSWFQMDDFVWLGLQGMVHNFGEFRTAMLQPYAQGTVRTLSERAFFLSFHALFGMNAFPYRGLAFLTQAANLVLIALICARLTKSRAAGFWAAVLWTANSVMAFALAWTAIYHELLCSLCFLAGIWFLIRYAETGQGRFLGAQWLTFLFGFGVLELNVVYPALALVYALCCARGLWPKILPMFLVSVLYAGWHLSIAPLPASGDYQMHWDLSILSTLFTYWKNALGPSKLILLSIHPSIGRSVLTVLLTTGLLGFLFWKVIHRQWVALFFAAWFVIVLAPMLPLRDRVTDYYLTIPVAGLAMLGGWGVVSGWRKGRRGKVAAASLLAIYLSVSIPLACVNVRSFYDRSQAVRSVVLGVVSLSRNKLEKTVFLRGAEMAIFVSAISQRPFRLYGIDRVFLLAAPALESRLSLTDRRDFILSSGEVQNAIRRDQAVVYDIASGQVRDVTAEYRAASGALQ